MESISLTDQAAKSAKIKIARGNTPDMNWVIARRSCRTRGAHAVRRDIQSALAPNGRWVRPRKEVELNTEAIRATVRVAIGWFRCIQDAHRVDRHALRGRLRHTRARRHGTTVRCFLGNRLATRKTQQRTERKADVWRRIHGAFGVIGSVGDGGSALGAGNLGPIVMLPLASLVVT